MTVSNLEDHPDANALGEKLYRIAMATPMADTNDRVGGAFAALIALAASHGWTPERLKDFCIGSIDATVRGMPEAARVMFGMPPTPPKDPS